jgi:hypothetical protein
VKKDAAYWVPLVVAIVVVVVGVGQLVGDSSVLDPKSTSTVTTAKVDAIPGTPKTTTEVVKQKGAKTKTTTTTEHQANTPEQPQKTVTTTEAGDRTFLERVLGDSGLVVLQIGAVLLAAFLAAAVFQRVILGEFAIKIGSLEVPAVAAGTAADGLEALAAQIAELDQKRRDGDADANDHLALLYKRLDLIEKEIDALDSGPPGRR